MTDANNKTVTGASNVTTDDLVLNYDIWAQAADGASIRHVYDERQVTCRNEISAQANKIWPNTTAKVPDQYLQAFQDQLGWRPTQVAPGTSKTEGIWYDMGRVNQGFDADGNLVPDYDCWMQPVGDPSKFDASTWRLVHSYGVLIVSLNDGTEQVIAFEDKLYHKDIPANNTGVVGLCFYEFAPMGGTGPGLLSPYQEAASGSNNEKFNGDYGTSVSGPTGGPPIATFDKSGPATVAPDSTITYNLQTTVPGSSSTPFGMSAYYLPAVVSDVIPTGTQYVAGSAIGGLSLPGGTTATVFYSTDNGASWTATEPAPASTVTNLQWWLSSDLNPGNTATVSFQVYVPGTYTATQVYNTGGVGQGSGTPIYTDTQVSLVTGTRSISGLVWQDDGSGAGITGDGTRQAGETTRLANIDVTLYPDTNKNGLLDAAELATPRATTTSAVGTGAWSFTSLPDGKYLVQVKYDDPQRPTGYILSSTDVYAVTIAGSDKSGYEFGFAPTLAIDKSILSPTPVLEGTHITYNIDVSNLVKPDGYSASQTVVNNLWLETTAGSTFAATPTNAIGAPDGLFASDSANGRTLVGDYVAPHPAQPVGAISKVEAVVKLKLSGVLSGDTLTLTVRRNGAVLTTHSLGADELHAFIDPNTGIVALDVTGLAPWSWSDFQTTNTGLTLTISGSGSIPTMSVDAFGYRVTTGRAPTLSGNVFWTDDTQELKMLAGTPLPTAELDDIYGSLAAVPTEVAFDEVKNKVYLGYASTGLIESRNPDGTGAVTVATGQSSLSGLAVDAVHGYVYWTRAGSTNTLSRSNLDGTGVISITGLAKPEGVAIDPISAHVYWVQTQGSNLQIRRSDLNLSASSIVDLFAPTTIGSGNHNPKDLEIDTIRRKLYWVDDKSGTTGDFVGVVNLDGTGLSQFITQPNCGDNPQGLGIDVANGYLYWSSDTGIRKVSVTGGTPSLLVPGIATLGDVEVPGKFNFSGTHDPDKTFSIVPLTDDYDPTELKFISASVAPTSVNTSTGLITWDNIGPINASATKSIHVIFEVLEPPGNVTNANIDNLASVANAKVANGLPTNGASDTVIVTANPAAIIGDRVWSDKNGDGIDAGQATEPGIAGVTMRLYDSTGTTELQRTVTDATGAYQFKGVVAGTYIVKVDTTTLPAGFTQRWDADGLGSPNQSTVTITTPANPANKLDQDFGYTIANIFYGSVWQDYNSGGTCDGAETGIPGVTVWLRNATDTTTVATTTTDAYGNFRFVGIANGSYVVKVDPTTLPAGSTWTETGEVFPVGTPGDTTLDNKISTGGGIAVSGGDVKGSYDFGYHRSGTSAIGDEVYLDLNNNGVKDLTEDGIANVTVKLYEDLNNDGIYEANYDSLIATTSTNANGIYNFTSLAAGNYLVVVDETDPQFPANILSSLTNPRPVALAAATTLANVDFPYHTTLGYVQPGSIGDFVFYDANRNGTQDANETGIPGVVLRLYADRNNNQQYDAGIDIDYGTVTTSSGGVGNPPVGFYLFSNLQPDSDPVLAGNNPYIVQVVSIPGSAYTTLSNQTADPNRDGVPSWDNTYPSLPAADNQDTGHWVDLNSNGLHDAGETGIFIAAGTNYFGADFGYQPTGAIGDYVWLDFNNNGVQDANENGLAGVAVQVSNVLFGGSTTQSTTTDSTGLYSLQGLAAGTYRVTVTPPAGMTASTRVDANLLNGTGTVGANSADITIDASGYVTQIVMGGSTLTFAVPNSDDGVKIDFGYRLNGSNVLSGKVVLEQKGPGLQNGKSGDATDSPVAGTTVFLYDSANNLLGSTVTDATGAYSFSNLPNGTYKVSMAANDPMLAYTTLTTDNYAPGSVPPGTTVTDNGTSAILTLAISGSVSNLDFAWVSTVDYDFGDLPDSYSTRLASDGARHIVPASPNLYLGSGVDTEPNGAPTALATGDDTTGTDDEDGVRIVNPSAWTAGSTTAKVSVTVVGTGWLVAWMDFDGDGQFLTAGEMVINQAVSTGTSTITFSVPVSATATLASGIPVRFRLFGSQPAVPQLAYLGVADNGEVEDYVLRTATVGDRVWEDVNGNGIQDAGEPGISGATVTLTPPANVDLGSGLGVPITTTTNGNGIYSFSGLVPDVSYTVSVATPVGMVVTKVNQGGDPAVDSDNPAGATLTPAPGQTNNTLDFGFYYPATIGNFVWNDSTTNGIQDAGETGINGVTVELYRDNGNSVPDIGTGDTLYDTQVTAGGGLYSFANVPRGIYFVRFVAPGGRTITLANQGADPAKDSNPDPATGLTGLITLLANQTDNTIDCGMYLTGTITGQVRYDVDNNGNLGDAESGLAGAQLKLYTDPNADGDPTDGVQVGSTVTTTATGMYSFANLVPGTYVVVEMNPAGYASTADSSAPNNDQVPVAAVAGVVSSGNDFLDTNVGTIRGQVRYDVDNDGNLADAESGLAGAQVMLYTDPNADGDPSDGVQVGSTVTTTGTGTYSFTNVVPGTYVVVEVNPAGYASTADSSAPNNDQVPVILGNSGTSTGNDFLDTNVADLSLTKAQDNPTPVLGTNVTFTVQVSNAGPVAAANVIVADLLPPGLTFVSRVLSQGSYDSNTGMWSVGTLDSAGTATLQIVATVSTEGAKTNTAQVWSVDQPDTDSTPGNSVASEDDQSSTTLTPIALGSVTGHLYYDRNGDGSQDLNGADNILGNADDDPSTVDLDPTTAGRQTTLVVAGEGTWTVDGSGNATFTPQLGFTLDPTPIPYTVSDRTGLTSNTATITIDYVPVATNDSSTGNTTGTAVTVNVLSNDTTGDAVLPATVKIVGTANPGDLLVVAGQGTWSVNPVTGAITFMPEPGYTGDPTPIQYTVQDNDGNTSNAATVTIDYAQFPPVAANDSSLHNPAGPVTLNVIGNDTDANGDLDPSTVDLNPSSPGLQTTLVVAGEGMWTVDGSGNATFTPQLGFTLDPTPIPYTVSDRTGLTSNTATITIDYVPVATNDSSTGNTTGTAVTVNVLSNDTTGDAVLPATVKIVGTANPGDLLVVAGQGTWSVNPVTGAITFTPEPTFFGSPTPIQYTVQDNDGNTSNPATVTITYIEPPPSITVDKTGPATIAEGNTATYIFTITNTSLSPTDPVTITGLLDDKLGDLLLAAQTADGGNPIVLAPGASFTFNVTTASVLNAGTVVNTVNVGGHDDENSPVSASDNHTVVVSDVAPGITVDKTGPATIAEGNTATYTFTITNTSTAITDPVTITSITDDKLGNLLLPAQTANGGNPIVLAPGASFTFNVTTASVLNAGTVVNTVNVAGHDDENSPVLASDNHTVVVSDVAPSITVDKTGPGWIVHGQTATYTFKITNASTAITDPVTVTSILDNKLGELITVARAANGGNPIVLNPGQSFTFTATSPVLNDLTVVNVVNVTSRDDENTTATATDSETVSVRYPPVANNDSSLSNPPGPVTLKVTNNDSDPNGNLDVATVDLDPATPGRQTTFSVAGEGVWTTDNSGNVTFTPSLGFNEDPTPIPYTVSDTTGLTSNQATITIDYVPVAASNFSASNNRTGQPATVDVLGNDTGGDTPLPNTVQIVGTTSPGQPFVAAGEGVWTVNPTTGAITFTPAPGFIGDPTPIQYIVRDAQGNASNAATVTVQYRTNLFVLAQDKSPLTSQQVQVLDADTGVLLAQFVPYEPTHVGGVRVAMGDLNGDGVNEIVTAPGRGRAPEIRIFTLDGSTVSGFPSFLAYNANYTGGVNLALGDVNGDGKLDIITAPSDGAAEIRVFLNQYWSTPAFQTGVFQSFLAFPSTMAGGATVAATDMGQRTNGQFVNVPDGKAEIVVGSGPGTTAAVAVFDLSTTPTLVRSFQPFSATLPGFQGGVFPTIGRINADQIPDIIMGSGAGGHSNVEVWAWTVGSTTLSKYGGFTAFTGDAPVHVAAIDGDGDGLEDRLLAAQGPAESSHEIHLFDVANLAPLAFQQQPAFAGLSGPWYIATAQNPNPIVRDAVAVGFGGSTGTWLWREPGTWSPLHNFTPVWVVSGDLDGNGKDDLVMNFGGSTGIWIYRDTGQWQWLHSLSSTAATMGDLNADGKDELILSTTQAGIAGTWAYYPATGVWRCISGWQAEAFAVGDFDGNGKKDVAVDFGAKGLWFYNNNNVNWQYIHNYNPTWMAAGDIDGNHKTDLSVGFSSGNTIWIRHDNGAWQWLRNLATSTAVSGDSNGDGRAELVVTVTDASAAGLWKFTPATSIWRCISGWKAENLTVADVDGNGAADIVADFGANGLWVYKNDASWQWLHALNPAVMTNTRFVQALLADMSVAPASAALRLTLSDLDPIVAEAKRRWALSLGAEATAALRDVTVELADLGASVLGEAIGNHIRIDDDAAGLGWFVDKTPGDDSEFVKGNLSAAKRIDLLTAVMHEMGHVIGRADLDTSINDVMNGRLKAGTRRA